MHLEDGLKVEHGWRTMDGVSGTEVNDCGASGVTDSPPGMKRKSGGGKEEGSVVY